MSSRAIVMVIVLVVVGFTIVSMREYFTREPEVAIQVAVEKRILVAKRNLVSGGFVDVALDLDWAAEPALSVTSQENSENASENVSAKTSSFIYENASRIEDFSGAVIRRSIKAGEPITSMMLMKSGEGGFMSAVLESGKRAVSISVNPISGNAGFVSPGDRVDLLVTYRVKNSKDPESGTADSIVTETFANNVRVLAVDQHLDNPENKAMLASTITVEVTPTEAEKISVASEMGKVSVSLVSNGTPHANHAIPNDSDMSSENTVIHKGIETPKYTMDGDVSSLIGKNVSATNKVRVIRADKVEELEFYQDKP